MSVEWLYFLDFAKAFDYLDRNALFTKLEYYGIKGVALNWFKSFLSDRKQCVNYRSVESELLTTIDMVQLRAVFSVFYCI